MAVMNIWKPVAIFSTSALVLVMGQQIASATSAGSAEKSPIGGDYRRMHGALECLRAARDHLMNAEHNHGGWRERAIEGTDRAIHETEEAIKWSP
jgi:hypothetical protein